MRHACALLALLVFCPMSASADEEPDIRFFYPIVTRRPVIERELEFGFERSQTRDGNTNTVSAAIEWPLTRWWQLEIEVPFVIQNPREAVSTSGPGDLTVENKFLLWRSIQHLAAVAGGFEVRLPSGSERRGLGGEFGVEPFLTAGIALGPLDVMAEIAYEWNLNNVPGQREQELTANLAVGWPVSRWFTPLLELNSVTMIQGAAEEDGPKLRGRTQIYLTPGFNVRPLPGVTFRTGVELPTSSARTFDYRVRGALVWEF
jgi:outer membrane putative beta-barrel porin/alpha-amylase